MHPLVKDMPIGTCIVVGEMTWEVRFDASIGAKNLWTVSQGRFVTTSHENYSPSDDTKVIYPEKNENNKMYQYQLADLPEGTDVYSSRRAKSENNGWYVVRSDGRNRFVSHSDGSTQSTEPNFEIPVDWIVDFPSDCVEEATYSPEEITQWAEKVWNGRVPYVDDPKIIGLPSFDEISIALGKAGLHGPHTSDYALGIIHGIVMSKEI